MCLYILTFLLESGIIKHVLTYMRGVHNYLTHERRQGKTLGTAWFIAIPFVVAQFTVVFDLEDGTRSVPTTIKHTL